MTRRRASEAAARVAGLAVLAAFGVAALQQMQGNWWFQDSEAYWQAALRLRDGEALYPAVASEDASAVFRYAPWFAVAWVPLTLLPKMLVLGAWTAVLALAAAYCAWVALRHRSAAGAGLAVLATALLVPAAATGNVQPLLVASLLWGVERRSGPLWVALGASLKAAPILLVAVYVGRREWRRAGVTVVVTLALVLPMLLFDLRHYPTDTAAATGPLPTWLAVALAIALAALAIPLARTPYGWLTAAAGLVFGIPRWSYYQSSFLLIGLAKRDARRP